MDADLTTFPDQINQAWNTHDLESLLSYYAPDYVGSDIGQAVSQQGHSGLRKLVMGYWRAFPDLQVVILDRIIQASRMTVVWVAAGTHRGPIMNIPATGRRVEVRGVSLLEVRDGRVVRAQHIWDLAGMLRHLGLLPELSSTEG